jgi:CO dehydrogenase/acetyl-CoA synthase beta subunit
MVKEQIRDVLESVRLYNKITTEEDVKNVDKLVKFLNKVQHLWMTKT